MQPTHPDLLDWLAAEFTHPGSTRVPPVPPGRLALEDVIATHDAHPPNAWTLKRLHKLIMLSNTYRMSSRSHDPRAEQIDPANDLLWRQNLRRLEAEAIRDSILHVSGQLNPKMGGRGFFPHLGGEVLAGASRPGLDWERSSPEEQSRRSIYAYIRRTMLVPALDNFDYSNTTSPLGERPVTTVAPQALLLLNDEFMQRQAAAFSERLRKEAGGNLQKQIQRGYELAFNRAPSKSELRLAVDFLKRQANQAVSLQSRLTFRPDVPNSLSVEYLKQLQPSDFLVGPHEEWQYCRGRWSAAYEGIRTVDRPRGPFALWTPATFTNGVVEATLYLDRSAEMASLLLRSTAQGDEQRGYELYLDPRQQRVAVLRHGTELITLAERNAQLPVGHALPVKVELGNARISIWLNGAEKPVLDVTDPNPVAGSGQIGIRAWGATLHVEDLSILADGKKLEIRPALKPSNDVLAMKAKAGPARPAFQDEKALESFCLLLFNLNEFIYVD